MNKVCLVNVQIGPYKNYFSLFLDSCIRNKDVDFLFFTDQKIKCDASNIKIVNISWAEVLKVFQESFDFEINLKTPYDLCDYKVAYGDIFKDYLKSYDYWGFCDTDLIFGDIMKFINPYLNEKLKILIRGHFTLFKNNKTLNTLYKEEFKSAQSDDTVSYKNIFTDDGIHHFDEGLPEIHNGINRIFYTKGLWNKVVDEYIFMDLNVYTHKFINADFIDDPNEIEAARHSFFRYDNGKLQRVKVDLSNKKLFPVDEFMYIHFQKRDMSISKSLKTANASSYYIIPNKFIAKDVSLNFLYNANNDKIYVKLLLKRIKDKLMRILK